MEKCNYCEEKEATGYCINFTNLELQGDYCSFQCFLKEHIECTPDVYQFKTGGKSFIDHSSGDRHNWISREEYLNKYCDDETFERLFLNETEEV